MTLTTLDHPYHFSIEDATGGRLVAAPFQIGIPLNRGEYFPADYLILKNTEEQTAINCHIKATSLWPDNSIKWCLIKGLINLEPKQKIQLRVLKLSSADNLQSDIENRIINQANNLLIKSNNYQYYLSKTRFHLCDITSPDVKTIQNNGFCQLINQSGKQLQQGIRAFSFEPVISGNTTQAVIVIYEGDFLDDKKAVFAQFSARMEFYLTNDLIDCSVTIHNPKPAMHPGGKWDQGDANSIFFNSLDIGLEVNSINNISWKTDSDQWQRQNGCSLKIYQESSGGDNWSSPVHKNRHNIVPMSFQGFRCYEDTKIIHEGKRALPRVDIEGKNQSIHIAYPGFWQNFPKSLTVKDKTFSIGLFPAEFPDDHELQPGEKKTHQFYIQVGKDRQELVFVEHPPRVQLNPDWIRACQIFTQINPDSHQAIDQIIAEGLTHKSNFFNKRECIDEYGWRNFGDLHADHETDGYTGQDLFVSHYNNQYDPLYGFIKQYCLTGDCQWFELANDLARHVTDIDIYHTDRDRTEYNHGLFWHTDHYLDAKTASHRSYSRLQEQNVYEDHAGGGGPGGQHCYTDGLLYHYLLTGSEASRTGLYDLKHWITAVYEGSGTILDIIIALKNSRLVGLKNILTNQYPLDRGTGNYLNTLMNCYYLDRQSSTLAQVEFIIQNTIHPCDDLEARDLKNVEEHWFYTVFLQSLCRYLMIKLEDEKLDESFYYARDTLLHYADWIEQYEAPYLETPEILEFPNFTWAAQDLRKANILYYAGFFASDDDEKYVRKADSFVAYTVKALKNEPTRTYTRILSLLMQNQHPTAKVRNNDPLIKFSPRKSYLVPKQIGALKRLANLTTFTTHTLLHYSLREEIKGLKARAPIMTRWIKK